MRQAEIGWDVFWSTFGIVCGGILAFLGIVAALGRGINLFWRIAIGRIESQIADLREDMTTQLGQLRNDVKAVNAKVDARQLRTRGNRP